MHRFVPIFGAPLAAALLSPAAGAAVLPFWFLPLRPDPADDSHPRVSGQTVVWQRGIGSAAEIWLRDDHRILRLTQDGFADELPEVDGSLVVWQHDDGTDLEVMEFDGQTTSFVTDNTVDDSCPVAAGGFIGWRGTSPPYGRDFYLFPHAGGSQITGDADGADDECPRGSAGNFAWSKLDNGDRNVWAWFESLDDLYQITTSAVEQSSPAISGERVAYVEGTGSAADIRLFDLADGSDIALTADGSEDRNPQIQGNRVVWEHFDGTNWEIDEYVIGGGGTQQPVTNNSWNDHDPQVSGDTIVWVADEPGHSQIWVKWHGAAPQRLTNDPVDHRSPQIDGELIAFQSCASTCDIWLTPETPAAGLALAAVAALAALARRR